MCTYSYKVKECSYAAVTKYIVLEIITLNITDILMLKKPGYKLYEYLFVIRRLTKNWKMKCPLPLQKINNKTSTIQPIVASTVIQVSYCPETLFIAYYPISLLFKPDNKWVGYFSVRNVSSRLFFYISKQFTSVLNLIAFGVKFRSADGRSKVYTSIKLKAFLIM